MTEPLQLGGLHHVTAVTGDAPANLAFYTRVLGMRLVKKTVNQDDVSAYHLFYGDELGRPGTELTFFDWAYLPKRVAGSGTVGATALRVPDRDALDWWARHLATNGVEHQGVAERDGRALLAFEDPEGQRIELVDDTFGARSGGGTPAAEPWRGSPIPAAVQIRGLHGVTLHVDQLEPTAAVLRVMGFTENAPGVFETGPGGPGTEVRLEARPELGPGVVGAGGVHHVAFRTANDEEQVAWRWRLARAGLGVTPVIDRFYFKSVYFREPGRVLFEVATDGPGFATDEDAAHLGERLSLPPFLEPRRAAIEAGLRPLEPATA